MHHIPQDKRSLHSAELIWNALLACLKEKPYNRVTISDLQRVSGIARSTFYRSFDNLSDVLSWKCEKGFEQALQCLEFDQSIRFDEIDLARYYFNYWAQNPDVLDLLVQIGRQDIIYDCHLRCALRLRKRYGAIPHRAPENSPYFISIRTSITIGVLMVWLERGKKESPKELVDILVEQLQFLSTQKPNGESI